MRPSYRPELPPQPQSYRTQVLEHLGLVAGMFEELGIANGLAVGVHNVGQEENFGMTREGILRPGTPFQGPKTPREAQ